MPINVFIAINIYVENVESLYPLVELDENRLCSRCRRENGKIRIASDFNVDLNSKYYGVTEPGNN